MQSYKTRAGTGGGDGGGSFENSVSLGNGTSFYDWGSGDLGGCSAFIDDVNTVSCSGKGYGVLNGVGNAIGEGYCYAD
jgi:hypothetical protein